MKYLILFLLIITSLQSLGQDTIPDFYTRPKNTINLTLLGNASLISVNYDGLLISKERFLLAVQIGIGYNEEFEICLIGHCRKKEFITLPHSVSANFDLLNDLNKTYGFYLETGFGGAPLISKYSTLSKHIVLYQIQYYVYPIVGFRMHPSKAGWFNFRVFATLPIPLNGKYEIFQIPGGISLGISF